MSAATDLVVQLLVKLEFCAWLHHGVVAEVLLAISAPRAELNKVPIRRRLKPYLAFSG
jgi:hypothetical protein